MRPLADRPATLLLPSLLFLLMPFVLEAQRLPRRPPARIDGQPGMVGPPKPVFTATLAGTGGLEATLSLSSADSPTAMRMANTREALRTAPWQPFQPDAAFTTNGFFPAQVWVQVGLPVGPAAHPVQGPHVESDPVVLRDPALGTGRTHLEASFVSNHGPHYGVPGTLTFRLRGLGDARQIRVVEIDACHGISGTNQGPRFAAVGSDPKRQPRPEVGRATDGSFVVHLKSGEFSLPVSLCRTTIRLLGDGGNFDPGVEYTWTEDTRDVARPWPQLSSNQTARFTPGPRFSTDPVVGQGICDVRVVGQRIVLEASGGPTPNACVFTAPEVLLPPFMALDRLVWCVEHLPATPGGEARCELARQDSRHPVLRFFPSRGRVYVAPGNDDYGHETSEANPILPGEIAPDVDVDLSSPRIRRWILPMVAALRCEPFVRVENGRPVVDRIRLVLDRIHYRAVPSGPGSW